MDHIFVKLLWSTDEKCFIKGRYYNYYRELSNAQNKPIKKVEILFH